MNTTIESLDFQQLSDGAKQTAISEYGQPPDDWYEDIYMRARQEGPERGFNIDNIQFSGFHSQGDGASWTGHVDLATFVAYHNKPESPDYTQYVMLAELIKDGWCEGHMVVSRQGYLYNHSGTMRSDGIDNKILYADDDSTIERGILEGANVKELAKSISTDELISELENWALYKAQKYADDIFKQLSDDYDFYTSEEYFIDICDINGWRFNQLGKLTEE